MYRAVPWPTNISVQELYQKLCTVQCQDPLTSAHNSCTSNYILYNARTLWHLCTTAVSETTYCTMPGPTDICVRQLYQKTTYCTMPGPSDICVQQLYQKLCPVHCHDPLTSVYNSCTRNYVPYSARTLWHLCTRAVPETMYHIVPGPTGICIQHLYQKLHTIQCQDPLTLCTTGVPETMYRAVPGPSDICVQELYQKLHTVQCQDPLTTVYNSCTRNYLPCNARTHWYLCTTAVPSTDSPYHACFPIGNSLLAKVYMSLKLIFSYTSWIIMPLWCDVYCISITLRNMDLSCDSTRHMAHCMFRAAIQLLSDSSCTAFVSLMKWAPSMLVNMYFFVGRFIDYKRKSAHLCFRVKNLVNCKGWEMQLARHILT